jgi:hypothetical protein
LEDARDARSQTIRGGEKCEESIWSFVTEERLNDEL